MIGIYDSGIGGLGIFNAVKNVLPQENIHYFGDTKHFPFGDRTPEEVRSITLRSLEHLAKDCALIVLACNTTSTTDLAYYREHIAKPLIGVVPVIKTAAQLTNNNTIALLATTNTVQSPYTDSLITQFAESKTVIKIACPRLADAVEHGVFNDVGTGLDLSLLKGCLSKINSADVVVLGCTHYTLIKGQIQRLVGPDVKVIDSNDAVARQVLRVMKQEDLFRPQNIPEYLFECSGNKKPFLRQVKRYTGVS